MDAGGNIDLALIEDALYVVKASTGVGGYDFNFESFFQVRHPWQRETGVHAIARLGSTGDYATRFTELLHSGIRLFHTPEQHLLCSQLPNWYPLLEDLTPRSIWFDQVPNLAEVKSHFRWPVFMKGARQTSKHQRSLSLIESDSQFIAAIGAYASDPILSWQSVVCREFIPLRPVGAQSTVTLPRAFEFRSFWWDGILVGLTPYWLDDSYSLTSQERADAVAVAQEAARRVRVKFLVVDVAQGVDGRWWVIECNDGQDSGYRAASPLILWRKIIDVERDHVGRSQAQTC